ncbi:hypothetical protein EUBSIR_00887 [[Eubacterium] siraeum DSM 15702]|uniref:Uncharacterized protein n=1 Tax=[Eubacterium] siraeum DSM 15702 TaxID=428128 RepID=B0MM38_9FIRM|nr:hypothetical protein EUBSIR_00887 [[Eubacterium] siraeum DSM 15702]
MTAKSVIQTDNVKKPFDIAETSRLLFLQTAHSRLSINLYNF